MDAEALFIARSCAPQLARYHGTVTARLRGRDCLQCIYQGTSARTSRGPGITGTARTVFAHSQLFLEGEAGCNFNLTRGVEEAAVVRTGDLTIRGLIGRCTAQSPSGGKKVGGGVDAVDVLVVGEVEDIGQQLQLI